MKLKQNEILEAINPIYGISIFFCHRNTRVQVELFSLVKNKQSLNTWNIVFLPLH